MKKYIVVKVCVIVNQSEIVASYDSEEEAKEYTKMFNKYYETGETIYAYYELKGNSKIMGRAAPSFATHQ